MRKLQVYILVVLLFTLSGCGLLGTTDEPVTGDAIDGEYKDVVITNGIGRSVNVITDRFIETYAGAKPVFDADELSEFKIIRTRLQVSGAVSYSSDSVEGFVEQQQSKLSGKVSASGGVKLFSASVSSAYSYEESYSFTTNTREMFYTLEQNIVADRIEIEGYRDETIFLDALSDAFIEDIEKIRDGSLTPEDFINLYGTHIIVSGYFGGKLNCYFYLKTENQSLTSTQVTNLAGEVEGGVTGVFDGSISGSLDEKITSVVSGSSTEYKFSAEGIGGESKDLGNFDQFAANYSEWADSFNNDERYSVLVDIPDEGLVAIWDLLPSEYSDQAIAIEAAFTTLADAEYSEFLSMFMKTIDYGDYDNFAGGTGTQSDPYRISTVDQLRNVDNFLDENTYFRVINDIDVTTKYSNWAPIGAAAGGEDGPIGGVFKGVFDGGGYTITYEMNTFNYVSYLSYSGLFGYVDGATIKNLNINATIDLPAPVIGVYVGGVAGWSENSQFENCSVSGTIDLSTSIGNVMLYVGGISGVANNSDFDGCTNQSDITTLSNMIPYVGGIVGEKRNTTFVDCVNSGTLVANTSNLNTSGITGDIYAKDND